MKNIKPFTLAVGNKMLPTGFDNDLIDKEVGKEYTVDLKPEVAFGKRNPQMVRMIPTKHFIEQKKVFSAGIDVEEGCHVHHCTIVCPASTTFVLPPITPRRRKPLWRSISSRLTHHKASRVKRRWNLRSRGDRSDNLGDDWQRSSLDPGSRIEPCQPVTATFSPWSPTKASAPCPSPGASTTPCRRSCSRR